MERKNETEENNKNKQKTIKKMATSTYLKIITLNVNKQIAPVKRHRMTEWLKKKKIHDPSICCYNGLTSDLKMYTK